VGRDREGAIAVLASGHNCCKAASACVTLLFTTALGQALLRRVLYAPLLGTITDIHAVVTRSRRGRQLATRIYG